MPDLLMAFTSDVALYSELLETVLIIMSTQNIARFIRAYWNMSHHSGTFFCPVTRYHLLLGKILVSVLQVVYWNFCS